MRSGLLRALQSANITINTQINRHAWVSWIFVYLAELIFFTAYRLSNLSDLVKSSASPDEDATAVRVYGVLLGIVQDFVVISVLVVVLSGFDATINRSSCCNDTAPNGCLDCFTHGIPFLSRMKLVFKRLLRFCVVYVACLLSVALFSLDVVTVRSYRRRYEFGWDSRDEEIGVIAAVILVWFDLTRWTPLNSAEKWRSRRNQGLPTAINSRESVNYLVMDPDEFFDSDDNENLSAFFDSNNRPIHGTQPPQPRAILSDDRRDLPTPKWKFTFVGLGLALTIFIAVPLLVLLITSYCPPTVASIALNSNLNEPIRAITTLSFARS
ncbi:hypothetical protein PHYSODRAFT_529020 [Phytophthora sojae]|uniref:Uncharacterized protein n=1 Tax=Phytophthora sojae (strain P6497) TaxID=1094619 RepID=G5AAB6_PHYSP|nr:hypothetical protein PHYSODRAFT_529020 [Phytophthora sojae]EGZ07545.1 hypothetical protein PHYSODRAFT_529020 [Phytophthora sojae]|eukprot:XP_009537111.1 hypothetical protein PHYSODRAFT_529020 [Phytophthora sojae]